MKQTVLLFGCFLAMALCFHNVNSQEILNPSFKGKIVEPIPQETCFSDLVGHLRTCETELDDFITTAVCAVIAGLEWTDCKDY